MFERLVTFADQMLNSLEDVNFLSMEYFHLEQLLEAVFRSQLPGEYL